MSDSYPFHPPESIIFNIEFHFPEDRGLMAVKGGAS